MVDEPKLGMLRRGLVIGLLGLMACGSFDSDDAEQVAQATRKTVERGVDKAKDAIDRVDMDKVRRTWDSAVDAVGGGPDDAKGEPAGDPLAGAAEAITCDEAGERCTVTAEFFDRARRHGTRAAKQVRITPQTGEVRGIRIDAIDAGTLAELVGLRTGDVVTHVNELPVGSMKDAMMLYMQLRAATRFTVRYRRGEQERTLEVEVVQGSAGAGAAEPGVAGVAE